MAKIRHNPVPHLGTPLTQAVFTNSDLSKILNGLHPSIISRDRSPLGLPREIPLTYEESFQIYMMHCWLQLMYSATGVHVKRKSYVRLAKKEPDKIVNAIAKIGGGEEDFARLVDLFLSKKVSRQIIG